MTRRTISDLGLASVAAVATVVGGIGSAAISTFVVDASSSRESDIKLIELAVEVLSQESTADPMNAKIMRTWAVDTINNYADVQFNKFARNVLINGEYRFALTEADQIFQSHGGQVPEALRPSALAERLSEF